MDLGGVVWEYPTGSSGGGKIGAPGKSTGLLGMLAITALALADVSFSDARAGLVLESFLSKNA